MSQVRNRWWRERVYSDCGGDSATEQSHKDLTDINNIVQRFQRTGELPPQREGQYADVTPLQGDFQERIEFAKGVIASYDEAVKAYERSKVEGTAPPAMPPPLPDGNVATQAP